VEKDAPKEVSETARKAQPISMEVDNLDVVLAAMKDVKIVMPVRTAFYGNEGIPASRIRRPLHHFRAPVAAPQH